MRPTVIAALVLAMGLHPFAWAQDTAPPATHPNPPPAPEHDTTLQQKHADEAAGDTGEGNDERARKWFGTDETEAGPMPDRATAKMRPISVKDLEEMAVYNVQGDKVGDIEEIVNGPGHRHYVVISEGGFFGMGEDRAALPLNRFWLRAGRLVAQGVTGEDVEAMGHFRSHTLEYTGVDDEVMIEVAIWPES